MLRCLVAAGSNALRRAAMRPRGDGALLLSESTPHLDAEAQEEERRHSGERGIDY